jgi:hypothetical protein
MKMRNILYSVHILHVWTLITTHTFIRKKERKEERMKQRYKEKKTERKGKKCLERKKERKKEGRKEGKKYEMFLLQLLQDRGI